MAAGYAWKQTFSGSGQLDGKVSFWGGKNLALTCSPPPTWACTSLQQNHTNTHKTTSLCTGFKTSHPFNVDRPTSSQPFHCSIHSFHKQHTTLTISTQKQCAALVFGFNSTSCYQQTWGGQKLKIKTQQRTQLISYTGSVLKIEH